MAFIILRKLSLLIVQWSICAVCMLAQTYIILSRRSLIRGRQPFDLTSRAGILQVLPSSAQVNISQLIVKTKLQFSWTLDEINKINLQEDFIIFYLLHQTDFQVITIKHIIKVPMYYQLLLLKIYKHSCLQVRYDTHTNFIFSISNLTLLNFNNLFTN